MRTFEDVDKQIDIYMDGRIKALDSIEPEINGDVYLFGIWSGISTKLISNRMLKCNYNMMYGFDSFEGLPEETDGIPKYHNFNAGAYSSLDLYGAEDACKVSTEILKGIDNDKLAFFGGFYKDVLTKDLAESMKPAVYVDIDVDLYCSTVDVLTWMCDNNLIVKNTVIYFDDWGSTKEYEGGESLAWKEAVEKYKIKYTQIYHNAFGESVLKTFVVENICKSG